MILEQSSCGDLVLDNMRGMIWSNALSKLSQPAKDQSWEKTWNDVDAVLWREVEDPIYGDVHDAIFNQEKL